MNTTKCSLFRCFKTSPQIIRLAVMMYLRFRLSLHNVEDLLRDRGTDICQETVRFWWHRIGPMFTVEIQSGVRWHAVEQLSLAFERGFCEEQWRAA